MNKLFGLFVALAVCLLSVVGRAEEIAGEVVLTVDTTYHGLTGTGSITAADGETPIVLTVDADADCAFQGTVSGNIKVVKKGHGLQAFSGANTFTGGLRIEAGWLSVSAANQLGSGTLTLAGGGLDVTAALSLDKTQGKSVEGSGTLRVASGVSLTVNGKLTIADALLTIAGGGRVLYNQTFSDCGQNGSIKVTDTATFRGSWGSSLGGYYTNYGLQSITVCEGAALEVQEGCSLHCELVLEGGTVCGFVTQQNLDATDGRLEQYLRTPGLGLNGKVRVLSCTTPSRIVSNGICLTHFAENRNVFDVAEGAALIVDGTLYPGKPADSKGNVLYYSQHTGQGFDKVGAGTMSLVKPATIGGIVNVRGGALELGRDAYLSKAATVLTENGGRLVLRDGSVFESGLGGINGLLAQADVWLDGAALALQAQEGERIVSVPNRGTAGGCFRPGTTGDATQAPLFHAQGINGLGTLYFNGSESLILTNFVNTTTYDFCSYCVHAKNQGWNTSIVLETGPSTWVMPEGVTYSERLKPESYELCYSAEKQLRQCFNYAAWNGTSNPYRSWDAKSFAYPEDNPVGYVPVLSFGKCWRKSTGGGTAQAWFRFDDNTCTNLGVGSTLEAYKISPRRIDTVNIGCRTLQNRETVSGGHVSIGEVIMFARALTEAEALAVESYLRRKWFNSALAAPEMPAADVPVVDVRVPDGEKAVFAGRVTTVGGEGFANGARLEKSGAGDLAFRGDARGAAVKAAGPVTLDSGSVSRAAVWVDATDSAAATVADGKVVGFVNKGRAGGSFERGHVGGFEDTDPKDKYWVAGPTLNASGINGRQTLSFDGNAGLMLTAYTNYNAAGANDLHVYAVLKRNSFVWQQDEGEETWSPKNGQGSMAAAFSFGKGAVGGTKTVADSDQDGAFVPFEYGKWAKGVATNYFIYYMAKNASSPGNISLTSNIVYPMRSCPDKDATESEYLFVGHFNCYGVTLATELPSDDPVKMNLSTRPNGGCTLDGTTFNPKQIDTVTLGGRFWSRKGTHPTFRWWKVGDGANYMWNGEVGEFIVFDQGLTLEDEKALIGYLRKKWFGKGDGSATPPACLTGTAASPVTDGATSLELADGTTVTKMVGALELSSLSFGENVSIRQGGLTSSAASAKLFDVEEAVSLAGPVSVDLELTRQLRNDWGRGPVPLLTFGTWSAADGAELVPVRPDVSPRHSFVRRDGSVDLLFYGGTLLIFR